MSDSRVKRSVHSVEQSEEDRLLTTRMANSTSSSPTHIVVLLAGAVQLLDLSPIDLFSMMTPEYLTACQLPAPLISNGVPMTITYVSEAGAPSICELTASAGLRVTAGLDDPRVAPGRVDILLIPGPDPREVPSEPVLNFVRAHTEQEGCVVMTVCTGVFVAGYAGILKGRTATGPRGLLITGELQKKFPEVKWVDKRWVKDGDVWCSGTWLLPFPRITQLRRQ